jgi:hypothetical protein
MNADQYSTEHLLAISKRKRPGFVVHRKDFTFVKNSNGKTVRLAGRNLMP